MSVILSVFNLNWPDSYQISLHSALLPGADIRAVVAVGQKATQNLDQEHEAVAFVAARALLAAQRQQRAPVQHSARVRGGPALAVRSPRARYGLGLNAHARAEQLYTLMRTFHVHRGYTDLWILDVSFFQVFPVISHPPTHSDAEIEGDLTLYFMPP